VLGGTFAGASGGDVLDGDRRERDASSTRA